MQYYHSIVNRPNIREFLIYCICLSVLGSVITGLGPMFPYYSEKQGLPETAYSFLFFCRAFGFITGTASVKILEKYLNYHQCLCLGVILPGIFLILYSLAENMNARGLFIFIASLGCAHIDVFTNVATIHYFKGSRLATWLQVLHGTYGIGGFIGPFIVYIFQDKTMIVFALALLILIPVIIRTPSPDDNIETETDPDEFLPKLKPKKNISTVSNYLLAGIFYFVVGQESTLSGWIPSYAVLEGFSTEKHATMYTSLYWLSITFFRFAFAFVPGKPSIKIYILLGATTFQAFLSTILIYHVSPQIGLIATAVIFGLSNSVLFPLLLIVPDEFNLGVTPSQNSNFLLFAALGEGTLAVLVGELMQILTYDWFIYSMGLINLAAIIMHYFALRHLNKQKSVSDQKIKGCEMYELIEMVNSTASRASEKDQN